MVNILHTLEIKYNLLKKEKITNKYQVHAKTSTQTSKINYILRK